MEKIRKQELSAIIPTLKKSDSSYLKKRFEAIAQKGLDHVRRENIMGTNREIEVETMNILRNNKKRFNESVERRYEYQLGNYLTNMIANEEVDSLEQQRRDKRRKQFEQGKGKGYIPNTKNQRHFVLRLNDLRKKEKSMTYRNQSQTQVDDGKLKSVGETFIPFVQERDAIGRILSQTLLNNRMKAKATTINTQRDSEARH